MKSVVIIIPALNPLPSLVSFIEKLQSLSVVAVVVVNDGSDAKYGTIFKEIEALTGCILLTHEENRGKGAALKTGFDYVLKSEHKRSSVVTVGAHGQHSVLDVAQIIASTKVFSDGIVLGVREFKSKEVPVASFVANRAISMLFELFFHKRLLDTQTGLRYLPNTTLSWLKSVPDESYKYDLNMLIEAIHREIPIYEVPIGEAKLKKNSLIYYDEVLQPKKLFHQLWVNYMKKQ